jgi:hypothetical protein
MEHEKETGESVATLERRREILLKKVKEYHKELDMLLVLTLSSVLLTAPDQISLGRDA